MGRITALLEHESVCIRVRGRMFHLRANEDQVRFPLQSRERNRSDKGNDKVGQPVRGCRKGVGRTSDSQWHNFDLVDPTHTLPSDGITRGEDEHKRSTSIQRGASILPQHNGQDDHGEEHPARSEQHETTATRHAVDREYSDEGCQEEESTCSRGEDSCIPNRVVGWHPLVLVHEHGTEVLCHEVDSANLLTELENDGEDNSVAVSVVSHFEDVGE